MIFCGAGMLTPVGNFITGTSDKFFSGLAIFFSKTAVDILDFILGIYHHECFEHTVYYTVEEIMRGA